MANEQLVLYGAGIKGKKTYNILKKHGVEVKCFCDTYAKGENIISPEELNKMDKSSLKVIVCIGNAKEKSNIKTMLKNEGIETISFEKILFGKEDVDSNRMLVAEYHIDAMDDYFERAESNLSVFWDKETPFYKMFSTLDLSCVVELACGHGRHVTQYHDKAKKIILVDILQKNIDICKERFKDLSHISYVANNGYDLSDIASDSVTSLFTYDAMVHFELFDIFNYLKEINRILKVGGKALMHHSNNTESPYITFSTATSGRNYMSKDIFAYMANRANLKVVEQKVIDWGDNKSLGCISLVEKVR